MVLGEAVPALAHEFQHAGLHGQLHTLRIVWEEDRALGQAAGVVVLEGGVVDALGCIAEQNLVVDVALGFHGASPAIGWRALPSVSGPDQM